METDLLWGYEGLTDYLGPDAGGAQWPVDAGAVSRISREHRSVTWPRPTRPHMAAAAGHGDRRTGGLGFARRLDELASRHDYYDEGDLLWLEVATIIHRRPTGRNRLTISATPSMAARTTDRR